MGWGWPDQRRRQRRRQQGWAHFALGLCALAALLPGGLVLLVLVARGGPALTPAFLFGAPAAALGPAVLAGGVFPALVGTLLLTCGAMVVAVPLGLSVAVYVTEIGSPGPTRHVVAALVRNLAAVPSIVFGLFGFGLLVVQLRLGPSLLAGSLTLALVALPMVATVAEAALLALPPGLRTGSLALGATPWQTVCHVLLPAARPGLLAAALLAAARVAGETAPVLFTAVALYMPHLPRGPLDRVMALPYHLYISATQIPDLPAQQQFGTALLLLVVVVALQLVALWLRGGPGGQQRG